MLPQGAVDVRLIVPPSPSMCLEPRHDIGVQPQCTLLFHRTIEHAPSGVRPVENLRDLDCIYAVIRHPLQRLKLGPLFFRQLSTFLFACVGDYTLIRLTS